jgi:hypothetical protein
MRKRYCERFAYAIVIAFCASLLQLLVTAAAAQSGAGATENPLQDPPPNGGKPVPVAVALAIMNISDIDEVAERFHLDAYLFMRWKDPRLAFTPDASRPNFRVLRRDEIWTPTVELINGVNTRERSDMATRAAPDGTVTYAERFAATLTSRFKLRRFPFDAQRLLVIIHPFVVDGREFTFIPSSGRTLTSNEFQIFSSLASWQIESVGSSIQPITLPNKMQLTEIRFHISVRRRFGFYLWKVFLPLVLMVVLSWTVFWIEPGDLDNQVQIAVTTILTVIAFGFAISGNLPRVPYLTYIDAFFLACYIFVFISIIELMAVNVAHRGKRGPDLGLRIRRVSRWAVPIAFVVTNLLMLIHFGVV